MRSFFKKNLGFKKNPNLSRGFSILELMVVLTIFAIMTTILIADIPNFREKSSLDLTVSEVATYIRGAQVYGAAQKGGGSTYYSMNFTVGSSNFDLTEGGDSQENYEIKGFKIGGVGISGLESSSCPASPDNISIQFKVNNYLGSIGTQLEPEIKVNNVNCDSFSYVEIKIVSTRDSASYKCVRVYNNGQIAPVTCD